VKVSGRKMGFQARSKAELLSESINNTNMKSTDFSVKKLVFVM
jgi:hypothetical protein